MAGFGKGEYFVFRKCIVMIFVTIGTQEPFDRLLAIIAAFSLETDEKIIVQACTEITFPNNVEVHEFLSPKEFDYFFDNSRFIIAHAGMGSIISALYKNRPIVIFPRIAALGEHRNEHQLATARRMRKENMVYVAFSEEELLLLLRELTNKDTIASLCEIGPFASNELLNSLEEFISH